MMIVYLYFSLLLILLASIGGYFLSAAAKKRASPRIKPEKPSYRCVAVRFKQDACDAVKKLRNRRFLYKNAPLLPLADCDAPLCECRYQHFADRRHHDRRDAYGHSSRMYAGQERRYRKLDRRDDDSVEIRMIS